MTGTLVTSRTFPAPPPALPNRSDGGSLSRLITSGNLLAAPLLHGRVLKVQKFDGTRWRAAGALAVFPNTAFLDNEKLHNVEFHEETNSLLFSFDRGRVRRAGRLYFNRDQGAFVGTVTNAKGKVSAVRGTGSIVLYNTRRRLKSDPNAEFVPWLDLKIENRWVNDDPSFMKSAEAARLVTSYVLGSEDVSSRTAVTGDRARGEITIELVPSLEFGGKKDRFVIVLASVGSFKGTYTDANRAEYEWEGTITSATLARNTADVATFAPYDRPLPRASATGPRARAKAPAPPLVLTDQDLDNVTSLYQVTTRDGGTRTVDVAQMRTGEFFNLSLINGLPQPLLNQLTGGLQVPAAVKPLFDQYQPFFRKYSYLATGQLLYDTLRNDPAHQASVARISPQALADGWKKLGMDETYATVSQQLYLEGFRSAVPGLQPFLRDDPAKRALSYYRFLTNPATLGFFQTQVASSTFGNVKERIYEWYVKLSVLDPGLHTFSPSGEVDAPGGGSGEKATLGQQMLAVAFSALVGVMYNQARFVEDTIGPVLQPVLENAADGRIDVSRYLSGKDMQEGAAATRDTLQQMIRVFDGGIVNFATNLASVLTIRAAYARANNTSLPPLADSGDEVFEGLALLFEEGSPERTRWESFRAVGGGILGGLLYTAGAVGLLYQLVQDAKTPGITPNKIITEIGLGVFSLALAVKGASYFLTLGVGDWLRRQSLSITGFLSESAGELSRWFTPRGVQPTGRLGKAFTALFGESETVFFARRLGPALGVFGVVVSAVALGRDIKAGAVREIVFDSVGVFFSVVDAGIIGVDLLVGFAWAGPVGVAVAVAGLLVGLAQFIWSVIDPPKPPADPVDQFISGPLKDAGFAT